MNTGNGSLVWMETGSISAAAAKRATTIIVKLWLRNMHRENGPILIRWGP